jgi:hypothetical protein
MVADACNPNYVGDRVWEDHGLRQAWQKISNTPISINNLGMVVYTCNLSYVGSKHRRIALSEASTGQKHKTLPEKQLKQKMAEDMAQVVEQLPSKHEAVGSNPSTVAGNQGKQSHRDHSAGSRKFYYISGLRGDNFSKP